MKVIGLRSCFSLLIPPRFRLPFRYYWLHFKGGRETNQWQNELRQLKRWRSPVSTAIDVGANLGLYSYRLAQWFGRVEAFEPNIRIVDCLRAYKSPRINIHNVALSSRAGEARLHVPISANGFENAGWGTLDAQGLCSTNHIRADVVPLQTLDSFGFTNVAAVKIDVEGHEEEVLAGALDTIRRCRPVILLEVKQDSRESVDRFFHECGYERYHLQGQRLQLLERGISHAPTDIENFFALPEKGLSSL